MSDIFISYARGDRPRVQALADALSSHGWSVWWDRQIAAGRTFDQVIADALAAARCVVVVWSKASIASDWVRDEADEGRRRNILVPITLDAARPPLGFGRIQTAHLGDWNGDTSAEAFRTLIGDLTALLGTPAGAPADLPAPLSAPPTLEPPAVRATERKRRPVVWRLSRRSSWIAVGVLVAVITTGIAYRAIGARAGEQPRPTISAAEKPALRLSTRLAAGGEPLLSEVGYEVFDAALNPEGTRKLVASSPTWAGPPRFDLPPGRYYVKAKHGAASAAKELEVRDKTLVQQTLVLHAGVLRPVAQLSPTSPPLKEEVAYEAFDAAPDAEGNRRQIISSPSHSGPPRFILPAGRYYVTAQHANASTSAEIEVGEGQNQSLVLNLHAAVLLVAAVLSDGSEPLNSEVAYEVTEAAKDVEGHSKRVASSPRWQGPPRFPIPAGRYSVSATYGSASAQTDVAVTPGETRRVVLNLHAGMLLLSANGMNGPPPGTAVTYAVYGAEKNAEGARKQIVVSPAWQGPPRLPLPRGRYVVTASTPGEKAEAAIDVPEGAVTKLELQLARTGQDSR